MRAWLPMIGLTLLLTGCQDELEEVRAFVQQTQQVYRPTPEPMPEIPEFEHLPYTAQVVRSPFVEPDPELIEIVVAERKDCLTPDKDRKRHPLESFALDDLFMRGTLGSGKELYALVQAKDGKLFRMKVNQYLGLFHGRIIHISPRDITIEEMIPEGDGCWAKRVTKLGLRAG